MAADGGNIWIRENDWCLLSDLLGRELSADEERGWQHEVWSKAEKIKRDLRLRQLPLSVEERGTGLRFRATGIAGTLFLRGVSVQVVPKFIGDGAPLASWLETVLTILARARRRDFTYSLLKRIGLRPATFVDHIALAYADALERALRQEPIHTYRTRNETSLFLRGRLSVETQMRTLLDRPHEIHSEVDYLDTDNQFNHLLHWAGRRFLSLVLDSHVYRRLSLTLRGLPVISEPARVPVTLPLACPPQYEHFSEGIEIASILAKGYAHGQGPGRYSGYGFILNMEKIFESFIEESLKHAVTLINSDYAVQAQVTRIYARAVGQEGRSYHTRPDNVVYDADGQALLLVDAKYKMLADAEEGTVSRPNNSDIYQLFASLASHECERGLLVYPRVETDRDLGDGTMRFWELGGAGRQFIGGAVAVHISAMPSRADLRGFDVTMAEFIRECLDAVAVNSEAES